MTKNEYRELMMGIIDMAIKEYEDDAPGYWDEQYYAGVILGLRIARHKLEASAFLTEKE
jgi:hypothetical protein